MPLCEQGCLALGLQAGGVGRLGLVERASYGLGERSESEAGPERSLDGHSVEVRGLRVLAVDPEWELHPLADLLLDEEVPAHPRDRRIVAGEGSACLEELTPRPPGLRGFEFAADPALAERDDPVPEISDVDEL